MKPYQVAAPRGREEMHTNEHATHKHCRNPEHDATPKQVSTQEGSLRQVWHA